MLIGTLEVGDEMVEIGADIGSRMVLNNVDVKLGLLVVDRSLIVKDVTVLKFFTVDNFDDVLGSVLESA